MSELKKQYDGWSEKRTKQHQDYVAQFSQLKARMTVEKRKEVREYAEKSGENLNNFVIRAIKESMERG